MRLLVLALLLTGSAAWAEEVAPTPIETPVVIVGGGAGLDGHVGSLAVGAGWGEADNDVLFAGAVMSRVLLGVRGGDDHTALSLTYGWYETKILSLGLDLGVDATTAGAGPTARFTIGLRGFAVQLTGGARFEPGVHAIGAAQLVVEVEDLLGTI